jgi:long-chain acyl-CoA synthetase
MAPFWEKSYPPGVVWDAPLPPPVALEGLLANAAAKWPDRIALDFYDRTLTFRGFHDLAARAAKGLQAAGVGPGVTVGLHLLNVPHFPVVFFAVLMAGGRVVNFSPLLAARELKYQIEDAEVAVMVTLGLPMLYPQIAGLKGTGKFQTLVVCSIADFLPVTAAAMFGPAAERLGDAGREIDFSALTANDGAYTCHAHGPLEDEVAVLQYTGGTTGQPKGAMLTHANLCAVLAVYSYWNGLGPDEPPEKALAVLPLFHIFGLTFVMLLAVSTGSQVVLHIRFDPDRVLADIARKKVTVFPAVPTMYAALVNHPKIKEFDLSSVSRWASGGAPLPIELQQSFEALTGQNPAEGYGLTETAPLGTLPLKDAPPHRGTVGLPAPRTLLEIVDLETGTKVLPVGNRGEICFTGPQVTKGYWKKPEATAEAFRGGRFHTGDIGVLDDDGFLTLVDRKKDMILSGGFNVFPRNIEEAIYEHPAVAEVTVIGIPDAYRGQSAKAFIALKAGQQPFGIDELKAFLADKLAKYEMPTEMEIRSSLPKTPVGKLSKKELVAEEMAKRQPAQTTAAKRT